MSDEKKHFVMGSGELTEEQRESIKRHTENKEKEDRELLERQRLEKKAKNTATLEELLMTKIAPTEDRVVVWPDPVEEFTAGGLLKPDEVIQKEKTCRGTVLAVGPGKVDDTTLTNKLLLAIFEGQGEIGEDLSEKYEELKAEVNAKKIPYEPGDRILYGGYGGTEVPDPATGVPLLIMRPMDIFAKI